MSWSLIAEASVALAVDAGTAITVTGVPKGSGERIGIDRDRDTYPDGDELDYGTDPGDPNSTPVGVGRDGGSWGLHAYSEMQSITWPG